MTDHRPIEEALALAASGAHDQAVALLQRAGERGNATAWMQLAVWHLGGQLLPRDVGAVRRLIRNAVAIGHVDGALMEVALTANGFGNLCQHDWPAAYALLCKASADPVANAQKQLVDAMRIDSHGRPEQLPAPETLCESPSVRCYPGLLTPLECAHVAAAAADLLEPAEIIDPVTGQRRPHPIRTSDGGALGPAREDLVVRAINLRLAAVTNTRVNQGEPLTILRYRPGQQYRPHLDTIAGAANQRIRTVLVYLNQGFGGGATHFPALNLTVEPRGGDAVVFDNLLGDGTPDKRALHAGNPVTAGAKWLATRWIRAEDVCPWTLGSI